MPVSTAAIRGFGFVAAFSEFFGGVAMIVGFAFRPAMMLLTITMTVAACMHLGKGEGVLGASHALENALFFFALLFNRSGALTAFDKK